jgi:hypothetical protein
MESSSDQSRDVGDVHHERGASLPGDGSESFKIDGAWVSARTGDDELGFMLTGEALEFVVVDGLRILAHTVGNHLIHAPGKIERVAVREVAAVSEAHAQHRVAGFEHRDVDGLIRLASRVRLDVGVIGAKEFLGALDGERFRDIDELAPAVVALAGQTLRVLVRQHGAHGLQHRFAHKILGSNQFDGSRLPVNFAGDGA